MLKTSHVEDNAEDEPSPATSFGLYDNKGHEAGGVHEHKEDEGEGSGLVKAGILLHALAKGSCVLGILFAHGVGCTKGACSPME